MKIKDNCKGCGQEFEHKHWDNKQYCSKECYYNKDKVKANCESCGKEVLKSASISKRNTGNYCSRECYDSRRKKDLKRLKRSTKYYDDLLSNSSCACGVSEKYLLQIHHMDGNHNNNDESNIEVVCANCHIKRHLKRNENGEIVHHPSSLTTDDILEEIYILI